MSSNKIDMPYFIENEDWYYYNGEEFKLTELGKSIPKVVESYEQFLKDIDKDDE